MTNNNTDNNTAYTAYISGNKYTTAFDSAAGATIPSAVRKLKRKVKAWQDCFIWATDKHGYTEIIYDHERK